VAGPTVDLYWAALDEDGADLARLAVTLADDELCRARRFRLERDRRRYIVRRAILRELLSRYLGIAPARVRLRTGPFGKPCVAEGDLRFSVTVVWKLSYRPAESDEDGRHGWTIAYQRSAR
jgi:4'-phosphopantetheinyl transferase